MKYSHLLSPIKIGNVIFKNRIFAAPSGLQALSTTECWPSEEVIAHFEARAKSGAACVTCVGASALPYVSAPGNTSWDMKNPQALNRVAYLARRIHAHGAKASMELGVAGVVRTGLVVSEGAPTIWGSPGKEMSKSDIDELIKGFAETSLALLQCDYDMIMLHFGHGMPVAQFLSPATNKRTDEYGGSFENRCRLAIEIIDAIRAKVGRKLLIEVRISGTELEEGGITIDEAIAFTKLIEDKIDMIHVSAGIHGPKWFTVTHPCGFLPSVPNIYLAEAVKKSGVKIPVQGIGGVSDLDEAEALIAEGKVDALGCCRGIIADEDLVNKAYKETPCDVRPCIKCMRCHDSVVFTRQFHCAVNPKVGLEACLPGLFPAPCSSKKVAVIGGGPAGMEAALEAVNRGHIVTLFEKEDHLGGTITFADHVSFKYPLHNFKEYLIRQVKNSAITLCLGTKADPELLKSEGFDEVIVAVGAKPFVPDIPGINGENVLLVSDVYGNENKLPDNVIVIGAGQSGCETALHLAYKGKKVTLAGRNAKLAPDASPTHRNELLNALEEEKNLTLITGASCSSITPSGANCIDVNGNDIFLNGECVVIALGSRSDSLQVDSFIDAFPQAKPVGDCLKAATVEQAIETAYIAANNII